jgi:orotidine-5'-phosphate decarboxylase
MKKIILALDEIQNIDEVVALVKKVGHLVYAVKIHNLYDKFGPDVVRMLKEAGAEKVWVDFKLYDIPNTVKLRAENIAGDIISVHAGGGVKMMKEAVASGKEIFAVTILTSFSPSEVQQIYNRDINDAVINLAMLAKEAGVSGIVCSPQELKMLRGNPEFKELKLVVPGIRSKGVDSNDQNRVSTPAEALEDGADLLVIGRQITLADDPALTLQNIKKESAGFDIGF